MRVAMTLTAALLALATSAPSALAQRSSGGGGTIGCDPGLPITGVQATQCRIFFKEALYGPAANPYAAPWGNGYGYGGYGYRGYGYAAAPVVRHRTVVHPRKVRSSRKNGASDGAAAAY